MISSILGIGAVTPLGRDLQTITQALRQPMTAPSDARRVNDELLNDPTISKQMRRADRFSRMATIAAIDAFNAAKSACKDVAPERIGMILSSGFGPHCRGFRFIDGMLDNGDDSASPTDFSHSVHGAALAYISALLDLRGPSLNATDFEFGFEEIVQLAQCWLADGACDRVLIGAVEEIGDVMLHCAERMIDRSASIWPGEGAVFLMLGPADAGGFAAISCEDSPSSVDLLIVQDPPLLTQMRFSATANRTITFTPYFGHSASGSAFAVLGGLLALQSQQLLGPQVQTAPSPSNFSSAAIVGMSSDHQPMSLLLKRT